MHKNQLDKINKLIINAGEIALDLRDKGLIIKQKEDGSPVSNADEHISDFIYNSLSDIFPHIPIICEERNFFEIDKSKPFWLVDPIDGTRSYINNKDSFTINIALIENLIPTYGFIYHPASDRLYYVDENKEFSINNNGKRLKHTPHQEDGYVAVVSSRLQNNTELQRYLGSKHISNIISSPSSIKFCMIAEGKGDVFPKFGPTMEWDIAAGHALIRAIGGDIITLEGDSMIYGKENFKNHGFIAMNVKWINKNS